MGRYRAPLPPASKYITAEGKRRLSEELDHLWRVRRPAVTKALSAAAAEGDRSENAEYIYRKKELGEIDYRVRHLRKRLDGIKVVDHTPDDTDKVYFGAWVELENEDGERTRYRIVGPDELDPKRGYISMDSPMGKALIGKQLDSEFELSLPDGDARFLIVAVDYEAPQGDR